MKDIQKLWNELDSAIMAYENRPWKSNYDAIINCVKKIIAATQK